MQSISLTFLTTIDSIFSSFVNASSLVSIESGFAAEEVELNDAQREGGSQPCLGFVNSTAAICMHNASISHNKKLGTLVILKEKKKISGFFFRHTFSSVGQRVLGLFAKLLEQIVNFSLRRNSLFVFDLSGCRRDRMTRLRHFFIKLPDKIGFCNRSLHLHPISLF